MTRLRNDCLLACEEDEDEVGQGRKVTLERLVAELGQLVVDARHEGVLLQIGLKPALVAVVLALNEVMLRPGRVYARFRRVVCEVAEDVSGLAAGDVADTEVLRAECDEVCDRPMSALDRPTPGNGLCTRGVLYHSTYARKNCPPCENPKASKPSASSGTAASWTATKAIWACRSPNQPAFWSASVMGSM